MSQDHYSPRDVWEFEKFLASQSRVWQVEAWNLRCAAELLFKHEKSVFDRVFNQPDRATPPVFFAARVARMLIAFSLENLIKALLLKDPIKFEEVFKRPGNLSWKEDGHDLIKLSAWAELNLSATEETYLKLWQLCSLWAGRYPIPKNEHHLPRRRIGLASSTALLKRSQKKIQQAIATGDPFLGVEITDLLHGGISDAELGCFYDIYDRWNKFCLKPD